MANDRPPRHVRWGASTAHWLVFAGLLSAQFSSALAAEPESIANYRIEARLDPGAKIIAASAYIEWRNRVDRPADDLWFHLYLNAFKNNRTTFARENDGPLWEVNGEIPDNFWGYIEIESLEVVGSAGQIVRSEYVQPDDGNPDDETVLRLELAEPVPPGGSIALKVVFKSKLPRGIARTGWVGDYYFAAQWFPKLGVFGEDGWNCHQYHAYTEYFANFGDYDVSVTAPANYSVAGTGVSTRLDNSDGTATHQFVQANVHDFVWVASPRFNERILNFNENGLPPVLVKLFLLPEHRYLGDRYLTAAKTALRFFGEWFGPYPYPVLSIVDPAYQSDTGGMEYPTLVTGGSSYWSPPESLSPEGVTIHEVGHQWWYGMVANNEFEEAWLDEGINSWAESRVQKHAYPQARFVERFFGGIPFVFDAMPIPFETLNLPVVRRFGNLDTMTETSWKLLNRSSYRVNSYSKPEVVFWTLERLVGEERMLKAMRSYFQRYAYSHPTTHDFIAVFNEACGEDMSWFFQETFFSSGLVDYAIHSVESVRIPPIEGRYPAHAAPDDDEEDSPPTYLTEVVVRRLGAARMPVEVKVVFEDGEEIVEQWDGQDLWKRYKYERFVQADHAIVDPDRKILLDVDPTNNSRLTPSRLKSRPSPAAAKWGSKWLFWVQNLLETFAFVG